MKGGTGADARGPGTAAPLSRYVEQSNRKCVLTCSTACSTEISHLPSLKGKLGHKIRSSTCRGLRKASQQGEQHLWAPPGTKTHLQQIIFTLCICHYNPSVFHVECIQPSVPPRFLQIIWLSLLLPFILDSAIVSATGDPAAASSSSSSLSSF